MEGPQFETIFDPYEWSHVPSRPIPPCCQPPGRLTEGVASVVAVVTGEPQDVLKAGLLISVQLTVAQIKDLLAFSHIAEPTQGSGKSGGVIKIDLARALIEGIFPDMPEQERESLIRKLGGSSEPSEEAPSDASDGNSETLLKLIACLDPSEKKEFGGIIKEAMDAMTAKAEKEHRDRKIREKLASQGHEPVMVKAGDAALKEARAKPAGSSAGPRSSGTRNQAPQPFLAFLPPCEIPIYFHWGPNNVWVEFKGDMGGMQRTKSKKFDKDKTFASKMAALTVVFEHLHMAYHRKFVDTPSYKADYKASFGHCVA